jgi:hypothetical protein
VGKKGTLRVRLVWDVPLPTIFMDNQNRLAKAFRLSCRPADFAGGSAGKFDEHTVHRAQMFDAVCSTKKKVLDPEIDIFTSLGKLTPSNSE